MIHPSHVEMTIAWQLETDWANELICDWSNTSLVEHPTKGHLKFASGWLLLKQFLPTGADWKQRQERCEWVKSYRLINILRGCLLLNKPDHALGNLASDMTDQRPLSLITTGFKLYKLHESPRRDDSEGYWPQIDGHNTRHRKTGKRVIYLISNLCQSSGLINAFTSNSPKSWGWIT